MFTLTRATPTGGDCTAGYDVGFSNEYTVREFIEEVLKTHPGEWGYFELKNLGVRTDYKHGRLLKQHFADELLNSKIVKAYASGGWSRMDYYLTIELKDEHPDKSVRPTEVKGCFQNGNNHSQPLETLIPLRYSEENQKDLQIVKLKRIIEDYKKYDARRKEYYAKSMIRLGMLESAFDELKECGSYNSLKAKVLSQRIEIARLLRIQGVNELYHKIDPDMIDHIKSVSELIIENEELKKRVDSLNYIVSKLLRKENNQ